MKAKLHFLLSVVTVLMTLTTVNCSKGGSDSSSTPAAVNPALYGTSCGVNSLNSQWGCLPQCGVSAVTYQGQCQQISQGYGNQYGNGGQYGNPNTPVAPGSNNPQMCQGRCGVGNVSVNGGQCLPEYSCGPCYGYYNGQCYIGDYAHQYYGM